MTKVLVTGGAGFIGSFLTDALIEKKHEVTIFDNLDPQVHLEGKRPDYLNKSAKFIRGDVRDYENFKKVVLDNEVIFHFAAKVGVGQSQYEIKNYADVNIGGTSNLLDIVVNNKNSIKKIVIAASMSSYGEGSYSCGKCGVIQSPLRPEEQLDRAQWEPNCPRCKAKLAPIPTPETASQNTNSIYALTKKAQEEMVLIIGKTYGIPSVALRFFNVFGPRQSLSNPYTGVAAIFMSRIKNNNRPVIFEDGLQTRDFIYVTDLVKGCMMAMENRNADFKAFNLGTGKPITIKCIAETIAKIYGKDIKPDVTNKFRKGDVRHCYADITKIQKELGYKPEIDFETGMKKLAEWARTAEAIDKYENADKELKERKLV